MRTAPHRKSPKPKKKKVVIQVRGIPAEVRRAFNTYCAQHEINQATAFCRMFRAQLERESIT